MRKRYPKTGEESGHALQAMQLAPSGLREKKAPIQSYCEQQRRAQCRGNGGKIFISPAAFLVRRAHLALFSKLGRLAVRSRDALRRESQPSLLQIPNHS